MPPPKKETPPHKMNITLNSLRNTTIAVDNDQFYYEVVTRFWHPTITKIRKLNAETNEIRTIAEIENAPGQETRLRFGSEDDNAAWIPASEWLKRDSDKVGGVYTGKSDAKYRWKMEKQKLKLVRDDAEDQAPLVIQHNHRRHFWVFRMSKHAWLEVKPDVEESMDEMIMSYLLVERQRREKIPGFVRYIK